MAQKKLTDIGALETVSGSTTKVLSQVGGTTGWMDSADFVQSISDDAIAGLSEAVEAASSLSETITACEEATTAANNAAAAVEEYETRLSNVESSVSSLQSKVATLVQEGEYYAGQWEDGASSPDMLSDDGNSGVADLWRPALVDCTDNTNETTTATELNRTNFLRLADGTYNRYAVAITEEMRACCDVALYLDADATEQYCAAGEFDDEKFYNDYGMDTPLYDADGNEIEHILRPWESTNTDHSIVIGNKKTLWLIDQVVGTSGYENKGVATVGGKYDGINYTSWKLAPTGLFASPVTTVGGAARAQFFAYCTEETNCQSYAGQSSVTDMFYQKGTYPRTNDVHQTTCATYARANNADTSLSYPFSEGGDFALNVFVTCIELLAGTKYLIDPSMFGSGISSDDACSSESTWLANGGVRYRVHTDDDSNSWSYCQWSSSSHSIYYASGSRTNMSATLNYEYPKEQCMESQMALSYAVETGVAEGEEFEFYGGTYWWESVEGVPSIADGHMNARVYKLMTGTVSGYDSSGTATDFDVEVVLRMSIFEGMSLAGDVYAYWGGGYEQVMDVAYSYNDQAYGNNVKLYIETDQTKFIKNSTYSVADGTEYDFESVYTLVGETENLADSWTLTRQSYTPYKIASGGSKSTGQCYYGYTRNAHSTTTGIRVRVGCRRRGAALYSSCSPRFLNATTLASSATRYNAGSAQCLLSWAES